MKILVICQFYSPEPFRISDICEELVRHGHEVMVVTGIPNYPMGETYPEYRHGRKRNETINGVKIHRCYTIGRKTGAFRRFLNYYSYAFSSTLYVSKLKRDFDVVFVYQLSPVMMASAGIRYKKKYGKKLVLYCLDLWPESLTVGGVKRGSFLYHYFHRVSADIYKSADKILVTSKMFSRYFADNFGLDENTLEYLPQYAEELFLAESSAKESDETINLIFAGNVGVAQSVETIIKAANEIRDMPNLKWHIFGDGSDLGKCKALASALDAKMVHFYGRKPVEEMPQYYRMADAMLVTMRNDPILSLTLPGKIQTYMAAGKPIIGAINGETAAVIREADCGYCCDAEDYIGLARCVREFCANKNKAAFSNNAQRFYNTVFSKGPIIQKLEDILSI